MASTDTQRAKELFLQALDLEEPDRSAWLERLASEDPAACELVDGLLRAHHRATAEGIDRMASASGSLGDVPARGAGQRLGDYELLEEVGSGAFGSVWRARQISLDRIVALKLLRAGRVADARALARLRGEAAAVARLDHPRIVPVYEVGEHDGHAYFSMKWIEGGTLAERLEGPLPPRRAARLLVDVARAVHGAHQRGLLHRDLKPSNILLDAADQPFVADFGIAAPLDGDQDATTQILVGTPAYMAPEQAIGGDLSVATDVWALGCILYELLAGRPAFTGDTITEVLFRVREKEPVPLRELRDDVPGDLETIVRVCLQKDPGRRYPSANALADDLERWLHHEPIAARRTGALERVVLFCRRSPLTASLVATAAGLLLLLVIVALRASFELGARLRESLLGQARATRLAGEVGARAKALGLLARAAAIRPGADLRDEAIACLATTDLTLEQSVERPTGVVERLRVDPDLRRFLLCDEEGLRILDLRTGDELARLGPEEDLGYTRWSRTGRWVMTKHHEARSQRVRARFHVWDAAEGTERLHRDEAIANRGADFSPDERVLVYGTYDGAAVALDVESGQERTLFPFPGTLASLRIDPGGTRIAVAVRDDEEGKENRIAIHDAETGEWLHEMELPSQPFDLCWTGDGTGLAASCQDARVYVFADEGSEPSAVCEGHAAEVTEVFACPTAPLLLTNAWDETARLWDATTGLEIRRMSARALGFGRDGDRLATADASAWNVWRVEHGTLLRTVHVHTGKAPRDLAFSPAGDRVVSVGPDGVYLLDRRSGASPAKVAPMDGRSVRFLPDGRSIVVSGDAGLWRFGLDPGSGSSRLLPGPLWGIAISQDATTMAVQGWTTIHLLDPRAPDDSRTIPGVPGMEYLTICADGSRIATGNWRGSGVRVCSTRTGELLRTFLPGEENVAASLSPDGRRLATASNARFELWDVESGERQLAHERWREFGHLPAPIAFDPGGTAVAFGLSSGVVRLVDIATLETRATLEAPRTEALFKLAFSPDGATLGTACGTNQVQLWDLVGLGRELDRLGLPGR